MTKVKCDIPQFTPLGASLIRISGGTSFIKPHYYNDKIVSLEFSDGKVISKGETIFIKKISYKINIIEKKKKKNVLYYNLKTANKTKSSVFITPMLGGKKKLWFYNQYHINTFIGIKNELEDKIILLYKNPNDPLFIKFKNVISQFRNHIETRNLDPEHILFIFEVPKIHKKTFKLFKEGKYSEFNKTYKLKALEYHGMNVDNMIGQILFKTLGRKRQLENKIGMYLPDDAELYSIPEKHEEHFDINYYL